MDLGTADTVEDTEKCKNMDIRQFYTKSGNARPEKRQLTEEEKEHERERVRESERRREAERRNRAQQLAEAHQMRQHWSLREPPFRHGNMANTD